MHLIRIPLVEHRIWIKECNETFSYESWKILPLIEPHQGNFKGYILKKKEYRDLKKNDQIVRRNDEHKN